MENKFTIERYLIAHEKAYEVALKEIEEGEKRGHWMWYIFPQVKGLGYSSTAQYYAIQSKAEAFEYYEDPILGLHLKEISEALLKLDTNDVNDIFWYPDDLKLHSSMTLFYIISKNEIFKKVIDKFFGGKLDENTIKILSEMN